MNIRQCAFGAAVAVAIFADANVDTSAKAAHPARLSASATSVPTPGLTAMRVGLGQVLDMVGALAALAKQL